LKTLVVLLPVLLLQAQARPADEDARKLFELGDYTAAERSLETALSRSPRDAPAQRARLLTELAEVRVHAGLWEAAHRNVEEALSLSRDLSTRRSAAFLYLRSRRSDLALPLLEDLCREWRDDAALRLARGIARARAGRFEESLADLESGLGLEEAGRDARFELALALGKLGRAAEALARLREILERDPYDAEATYQASRQLLALRKPAALRQAALTTRYFESLRELEGPSSLAEHLAQAGRPFEAALEAATKWERMGRYDRVLAELARARALRREALEAPERLAEFWGRMGFGPEPRLADLEAAMRAAAAAGDSGRAIRAARLLAALSPANVPALSHLAASAADPALSIPRLHLLSRLVAADPGNPRWAAELDLTRRTVEGRE
jgi:tetratricopeptide (TPR) repeat protein